MELNSIHEVRATIEGNHPRFVHKITQWPSSGGGTPDCGQEDLCARPSPAPLGEGTRAELHILSPRRRIERPAELSFRFSFDALIPRRSCMRVRTLGGQYFRAANG